MLQIYRRSFKQANTTSKKPGKRRKSEPEHIAAESSADESSAEEDDDDADLGRVQPNLFEELKLVLVVRSDLGMTKGKIAAQCSHATLACYKSLQRNNPALIQAWESRGQAKIALKAENEDELLLMEAQAKSLGVCARSIQDACVVFPLRKDLYSVTVTENHAFSGRTQIAAGSRTVLGVGPAPISIVNKVTGHLKCQLLELLLNIQEAYLPSTGLTVL